MLSVGSLFRRCSLPLTPCHPVLMQTNIIADGFRSLAEGEPVEFVVEDADGRPKAVEVTGPGGANPQVRAVMNLCHTCCRLPWTFLRNPFQPPQVQVSDPRDSP